MVLGQLNLGHLHLDKSTPDRSTQDSSTPGQLNLRIAQPRTIPPGQLNPWSTQPRTAQPRKIQKTDISTRTSQPLSTQPRTFPPGQINFWPTQPGAADLLIIWKPKFSTWLTQAPIPIHFKNWWTSTIRQVWFDFQSTLIPKPTDFNKNQWNHRQTIATNFCNTGRAARLSGLSPYFIFVTTNFHETRLSWVESITS